MEHVMKEKKRKIQRSKRDSNQVLVRADTEIERYPLSIYNIHRGRGLLLDFLKNMMSFIVLDDIGDDMQQLRSLLILDKHMLGSGHQIVVISEHPQELDNVAKVD
ncbi:hypothetical protein KP509_33G016600 [Ceratopteris richardii]|uniref:Uncharacterized protein n=1 Tax=Ceratopteris richardii TaxID=49495 RepID=A0A8T2QNV9_CERRI|nr:hypothetical protein KP509_33G016600 [Ceratopteris richardii]